MRSSCVAHPTHDPLILIRQWQLRLCEGNYVAAALMSYFEYWHNIKSSNKSQASSANDVAEKHGDERVQDESLWQRHSVEELEAGLMGIAKRDKIREALDLLENKLHIITVGRNPNPRYSFDATKHYLFRPDVVNALSRASYPSAENRTSNDDLSQMDVREPVDAPEAANPSAINRNPSAINRNAIEETSLEIPLEKKKDRSIDRSRPTTPPSAFAILEKQPETETAEKSAEVGLLTELSPPSEAHPLRGAAPLPERWLAWGFDEGLNARATQALAGKWTEEQLLAILDASDRGGDRTKYLMRCLTNEPPVVKTAHRSYHVESGVVVEGVFAMEPPPALVAIMPAVEKAPTPIMDAVLSSTETMWQQVIAEVSVAEPTLTKCLQNSKLERIEEEDGQLRYVVVGVDPQFQEWVAKQAVLRIKRTLGSFIKMPMRSFELEVGTGVAA